MTLFFNWVAVALLAGLMALSFLGFRTDRRWWLRPLFALFAVGLLLATAAMVWLLLKGGTFSVSDRNGYGMLVAAIFTWWGVIAYARRPRDPLQVEADKRKWGCFRILLAIIACVVIAYAMFVLLVMGMGLLIGLGGYV